MKSKRRDRHLMAQQQQVPQVQTISRQVQITHQKFPPPAEAERYELIMPGFVDRWFKIVEKSQDDDITSRRREDHFGLIWSLSALVASTGLALAGLIGGFVLILNGKEVSGWVSLGITAVGVGSAIRLRASKNLHKD